MLTLEPYKTKASRFECPNCGHKNVFARYVDESGDYLSPEVGRCNRESKCGYHLTPRKYFAARPSFTWTPKPMQPKLQPKPFTLGEIPLSYLEQSVANLERNTFVRFLLSRYDCEQVLCACNQYLLGDFEGFTTFWRVDEDGHINTAKMIRYDANTGKRIKDGYSTDWIHAKLKRDGLLPEDFDYRRSLFGQHLLSDEASLIAIVEAEKTAIIASLELPEYVWLACGGKTQISVEKLARLGKRRVILFPDGDGFKQWSKIASEARAKGLNVSISDLLDSELTTEQKADGWDLADYLFAPEPITAQAEVTAVAIQRPASGNVAPVTTKPSNTYAALFADHCKRCGDYLQPDGSCQLCKQPLPF